ncbi:MAG: T9SS type A sorting domain-containing protein [Bacteroidales bacterium]
MIKKTISIGLMLMLGFCTSIFTQAQTVEKGEAATITYIDEAPIGTEAWGISSNGKYIVGGNTKNLTGGFLYSVDSGRILTLTEHGVLLAVANTGKVVGSFFADYPHSSIITSGIYRNNKWDALQLVSTGFPPVADTLHRKVGGPRISADGSTITGLGWNNYYYKDEPARLIHQGGIWHDTVLFKALKPHYPYEGFDFSGYGCAAYNISADGKTALGASAMPGSYTGYNPVIWIKDGDSSISFSDDIEAGIINGSNADGSVLVGYVQPYAETMAGAIWNNGVRTIVKLPGRSPLNFFRVGDNGIVLTKDGRIWTKDLGLMDFSTFLRELYGLDASMMATDMSTDGRVFCGSGSGPAIITLGEQTINTRPKNLITKQERGTLRVNISWTEPYKNGREILGYNVYRDSVKVNTALVSALNFTDPESTIGTVTYRVTAVYATGESKKSSGSTIDVIAADGCYSIKNLNTYTEYNRNVTISWQAPSDAVVRNASAKDLASTNFENITDTNAMDLVALRPLGSTSMSAIQVGDKYYVGDWTYLGIKVYDLQWKYLEILSIRNLPPVSDFAYDGQFLYTVGSQTKFIYKINLEDLLVEEFITSPANGQHIAFIPSLDSNRGGFEVGDWNTSFFINRSGKVISEGLPLKECAGTTFYDGRIYASQQTGETLNQVVQYDITTKKPVGKIFEPATLPQIKAIGEGYHSAGGISIMSTLDSTLCLCTMVQTDGTTSNELAFFELKPSPEISGFNLYRNDVLVNTNGLLKRHNYTEIITEPGTYVYQVTAKFRNGCEAKPVVKSTVTIVPSTGCAPVKQLDGKETYGNVKLTWALPPANPNGNLAGFYLYKDGQLINKDLYKKLEYVDVSPSLGKHAYRIEAFFDNSCSASDSIEVDVNNQGFCLPVNQLSFEQSTGSKANTSNVKVKWELPYFEEPLPLRYGTGINAGSVGEPTGANFTAAAAWDSAQLKPYENFKLIGMEIFLADPAVVTPLIMIDDSIVYQFDAGKIATKTFSTIFFDRSFPISTINTELALGYTVSFYKADSKPVGYDAGPAVKRRGDLYTLDFKNWSSAANTLGINANWNIAALLARDREIDTSANAAKTKAGNRYGEIYKVDIATGKLISEAAAQITKSNSASIKLNGFNVYRDGAKLNATPIKTTNYLDANVPYSQYIYTVGSLWNSCDEVMSKDATVQVGPTSIENDLNAANLSIYPNPAKDYITISGNYTTLTIVDLSGHQIAKYPQQTEKINLSSLKRGVYMLHFTTSNFGTIIKKVIVL